MKKVIIVIDSGYYKKLDQSHIVGGIGYRQNRQKIEVIDNYEDENGHGSACVNVISRISSNAYFYIIKILDQYLESSIAMLNCALEHCLTLPYNFINLSLSTLNKTGMGYTEKLCKRLKRQGKIIIASVYNNYDIGYPAAFDSVIGVFGSLFSSKYEYWFDSKKKIQCIGNKMPFYVSDDIDNYYLFGGTSSAAALIMGNLFKNCLEETYIDYTKACKILERGAKRNKWFKSDLKIDNTVSKTNAITFQYDKYKKLLAVLERIMNRKIENIGLYDNLFDVGLDIKMFKSLIRVIEDEFEIDINRDQLNYLVFQNINNLLGMIN